jgi:hypothetical protein
MMKKIFVMLFALAGSISMVQGQKTAVVLSDSKGWHKIGEITVDFQKSQEVISVIGADKFKAIKFMVTDAPVEIQDMDVYFEDGTKQSMQLRSPVNVGSESKALTVEGGEKDIDRVVFMYKALPNRTEEKAHVELWGLKTNEENSSGYNDNNKDNRMDKKADNTNYNDRTDNNGVNRTNSMSMANSSWEKLGEANVDFSKDRDEIRAGGNMKYSALKFMVTEAPIEISSMEVYYANGEKQDVSVGSIMKQNGESRIIDIQGAGRDLQKVVFTYKTVENANNEKAHVELYGLTANKEMHSGTGYENSQRMNDNHANTNDNRDNRMSTNDNRNNNTRADNDKDRALIAKPAVVLSDKEGWHKIGETTVNLKEERDEVGVIGADKFAKLKFKIDDASVDLNDMDIYYHDGTKQNVALSTPLRDGKESRIIDIPGGEKAIKRIAFRYKTLPNQGKDKAHVEIWGLKSNTSGK